MCTSLLYTDKNGAPYAGRTLELPMELPYLVAYFPAGEQFNSTVNQHEALEFASTYSFLAVTVPNGSVKDLKVVEGLNEAGLTFSLLAYAGADGPADMLAQTIAVLSAIDLGVWTLAQFGTVAEVKSALEKQAVLVAPLAALGEGKPPFHYTLHDRTGASIVIEYAQGKQTVYDNPIGVMTNGPEFSWHMTNLNNYTFLSNQDRSEVTINGQSFVQPDSGIATAGLPSSNTSVGRFIRAVYYSQFAEKAANADGALQALAHVMNNFDRPRGISLDPRTNVSAFDKAAAVLSGGASAEQTAYSTEYTSWTSLTDLTRNILLLRTYDSLNYAQLNLEDLAAVKTPKIIPLEMLKTGGWDATAQLLNAKAS